MFPQRRMRRIRRRTIQPLFRETELQKTDLVMPVFVDESISTPLAIPSMPGQFRHPVDEVADYCERLQSAGIGAVILFGIPAKKDNEATEAYATDGVVQRAIRNIRERLPGMVIATDVCACEYTDHGHCGIIGETADGPDLENDLSLALMGRIAVSHAESGVDIVAPSCMLDGWCRRSGGPDAAGYQDVLVMSYSKFASALYGPFRDAADSGFSFGDRTYQIDRERPRGDRGVRLDAAEGADILMVKPAGYTSIYPGVTAFVAGGAWVNGTRHDQSSRGRIWLDEQAVALESLIAIKRPG